MINLKKYLVLAFVCNALSAADITSNSIRIYDIGSCWYFSVAYTTAEIDTYGYVTSTARLNGTPGAMDNVERYFFGFSGPVSIQNQTWDNYYPNGTSLVAGGSHFVFDFGTNQDQALSFDYWQSQCDSNSGDDGGGGSEPDCEGGTEPGNWDPLNEDPCDSPILIDLGNDGIACGGRQDSIQFDLWGTGLPIQISWTLPATNDAFLALDLNQNGVIDDGRELFGSGTRLWLQDHLFALNGFVGLAQYDFIELGGNQDGVISPADDIWPDLLLWRDLNANGVSEPGELSSLDAFGFRSLETIPKEKRVFDDHGNWFRYWASASSDQGRHEMIDVYFKRHLTIAESNMTAE